MALTITAVAGAPGPVYSIGNLKVRVVDCLFDSSYTNEGEALVASDLGLSVIVLVLSTPAVKADGETAVVTWYDAANGKLQAFWAAASATYMPEVSGTPDLSDYTCRLFVLGY